MTARAVGRAPGPLLPRGGDRTLPWLAMLGLMSFVAALLAIGVAAGGRTALDWRARLDGSATVAVQGAGLESADAAAARAGEILASAPGVTQVSTLDPSSADGVIAGLMQGRAAGAVKADVRLLAVTFAPHSAASAAALIAPLRAQGLTATADDHRISSSRLWRDALFAGLGLLGAGLVMLAATYAVARLAIRRCLDRHRPTLELLHTMGAPDGLIVGLVRSRVGADVALSTAAGVAAAILATAAWRLAGGPPTIAWTDLTAALPWVLATALLAVTAASLATRAVLQRAP